MFFFFGPLVVILPVVLVLLLVSKLLFRHTLGGSLPRGQGGTGLPGSSGWTPASGLESRVFALAYRMGGRVTVSDVVIETGLGIKEAEALLDRMTDEVRVCMVVEDHGGVTYEFPEIVDRLSRERG